MSRIVVKKLGLQDYLPIWQAMKSFTEQRSCECYDELWVLEHFPVFTQGLNGKPEHVLNPGSIPVIQVDRGGQVTYHGPGQVVIYLLLDLHRLGQGVRWLVDHIEQGVIDFLNERGIQANTYPNAPGVYVANRKIASLWLRIKRGCSYHGVSFNADMDLSPFHRINPCGHQGLKVTQLRDLGINMEWSKIADRLCAQLCQSLGYTSILENSEKILQ